MLEVVYYVQKAEWHDANHAHERNQASYLEENFAPLEDSVRRYVTQFLDREDRYR